MQSGPNAFFLLPRFDNERATYYKYLLANIPRVSFASNSKGGYGCYKGPNLPPDYVEWHTVEESVNKNKRMKNSIQRRMIQVGRKIRR